MALSKGHTFTSGEVVTPTKLNNLVDNATIGDGTITTAMIADDAVTSDKIADGSVTSSHLASGAGGGVTSVTAGNGLDGGEITSSGTIAIPTSGGTLNINSGKVGIGGDADSTYHTKITGDVLIKEDSDTSTVLTIENAHASGGLSTLLLYAHTPIIQFNDKDAAADTKVFNLVNNNGVMQLVSLNDAGSTVATAFTFNHDGNVKLDSLPTTDPGSAGYLWNDGGVVRVSGSSGFSGGGSLSKYDSGWVATVGSTSVANGATLTFTHGLNTSALTYVLYAATDSSGSDSIAVTLHPLGGSTSSTISHGAQIQDITSTTLKAQLGTNGYVKLESDGSMDATSGTNYNVTFTYVRVVAIG